MNTHTEAQQTTLVTVDVHTMGRTFDETEVDRWELKAARRALMNLKNVAGGQVMMDLLAERCAQSPRVTALVCAGESVDYAVLDERVNRLAWLLRHRGIGPEQTVALAIPRSIDAVIARRVRRSVAICAICCCAHDQIASFVVGRFLCPRASRR